VAAQVIPLSEAPMLASLIRACGDDPDAAVNWHALADFVAEYGRDTLSSYFRAWAGQCHCGAATALHHVGLNQSDIIATLGKIFQPHQKMAGFGVGDVVLLNWMERGQASCTVRIDDGVRVVFGGSMSAYLAAAPRLRYWRIESIGLYDFVPRNGSIFRCDMPNVWPHSVLPADIFYALDGGHLTDGGLVRTYESNVQARDAVESVLAGKYLDSVPFGPF
jgi:hypothetical protein